ncbi:hypothetical protein BB559_000990 [Furculomyces boomerangus]|uniref:RCC1-like domain-containing protein n=2 Tax=Harpellales TaxID=61421 RepID=A0A2T9Z3E7_9FUNG|nr:hypothetical protein BB559_004509 [Furculomyces boomerangus]PVU99128.1 hypothetical protein BB559_000990 [Furculomyces boomerangus]PWA02939.1 hypothetical protein BB558_000905 [Smittium angustum]
MVSRAQSKAIAEAKKPKTKGVSNKKQPEPTKTEILKKRKRTAAPSKDVVEVNKEPRESTKKVTKIAKITKKVTKPEPSTKKKASKPIKATKKKTKTESATDGVDVFINNSSLSAKTRKNAIKSIKDAEKKFKKSKKRKQLGDSTVTKQRKIAIPIFQQRKFLPEINIAPEVPSISGDLFVFGNGDCGQLGLGEDMIERKKPYPVDLGGEEVVDVQSGGLHTIALCKSGKVWSWGCNDQKALGRSGEEYLPGIIEGLEDKEIVKIACGDSISLALTKEGRLYSWGTYRSAEGIMGFSSDTTIQETPKMIEEIKLAKIVDVATGVDHVLALSSVGEVYTWGNGQQFQLGRKVIDRRLKAGLNPDRLHLRNVVSIGAGSYHSFAATNDGTLFSWGLNNFGQCGLSPNDGGDEPLVTVPTEVAALKGQQILKMEGGEHHSIVMNSNGELFGFGRSDSHQTGLPQDIIDSFSEVQKKKNEVTNGDSSGHKTKVPIPTLIPNLEKIKSFSCGSNHNLAVSENGKTLYSWGYGDMLQCGNGEEEDVDVPTAVSGQKIDGKTFIKVSGGGQHSALIAA